MSADKESLLSLKNSMDLRTASDLHVRHWGSIWRNSRMHTGFLLELLVSSESTNLQAYSMLSPIWAHYSGSEGYWISEFVESRWVEECKSRSCQNSSTWFGSGWGTSLIFLCCHITFHTQNIMLLQYLSLRPKKSRNKLLAWECSTYWFRLLW